ncbi:MAG TPA: MarR family winged helix-turn-helix transcriptional regulator [Ktedonosporobacter sp.]|nr:MarR family winged helix-turn-helix transcriptional regulator [Ktedonosporobacter sp.]
MSSFSQGERANIREEFSREIRQFTGINASFFRVAATRIGIAVTDMQVLDILDLIGPATAGQLADLTGLTTGAITRILDRLEKAGLVYRERDPTDGRKVIVRLERGRDEMSKVRSILDSVEKTWDEVGSRYDDEQIAFLLQFLKYSNTRSRKELAQLQQEVPAGEREIFSAPLEGQESGRLIVSCGISRLTVRVDEEMAGLYQARFEGPVPGVKVKDGVVTIRYPRRLLGLGEKQGAAEVALSIAIPWWIAIQGGAAEAIAELGGLNLAGLEVKGGFNTIRLDLPTPTGRVPLRLAGGASEITVRRPAGVAARINFKGWADALVFDDQTFSVAGNISQLQSPGFDPTAPCYDIEITSYANRVTITSG